MANSKKKCKHCKQYFQAEGMVVVPAGTFCSMEHAIAFANEAKRKKSERQKAQEFKEMKQRVRDDKETIPKLKERLQRYINRLAKMVNARDTCISCGKPLAYEKQIDGGHFIAVGQCDAMRFNIMNIHPQCVSCNDYKGGNQLAYEQALRLEKGDAYVDYLLEQRRVANHIQGDRVWDRPALRHMIKWTRRQIRQLENQK